MIKFCGACYYYQGRGTLCSYTQKNIECAAQEACSQFQKISIEKLKYEKNRKKREDSNNPNTSIVEMVRTGTGGEVEIISRQPKSSPEGISLVLCFHELQKEEGENCTYSIRYV